MTGSVWKNRGHRGFAVLLAVLLLFGAGCRTRAAEEKTGTGETAETTPAEKETESVPALREEPQEPTEPEKSE